MAGDVGVEHAITEDALQPQARLHAALRIHRHQLRVDRLPLDVETQAVIEAYNLPGEFPESCIEQARELSEMFNAEMKSVLDAVGVRDKAFVRELKSRQRDASDGVKRAEAGATAQRAYAPAQDTMQPRFTDKAG
jgi:hypothetical protein